MYFVVDMDFNLGLGLLKDTVLFQNVSLRERQEHCTADIQIFIVRILFSLNMISLF